MHWATEYIGTPWVSGVSDCWHFARRVWREQFGIVVPVVNVDAASALAGRKAFRDQSRHGWHEVQTPMEGDAVLMTMAQTPCHVGIWLDPEGGGVLHSVEGIGAIFTPDARLAGMGYHVCSYHRRLT